jgi:hypothetical protein
MRSFPGTRNFQRATFAGIGNWCFRRVIRWPVKKENAVALGQTGDASVRMDLLIICTSTGRPKAAVDRTQSKRFAKSERRDHYGRLGFTDSQA